MVQMESPKRKMQKKNDYQRHKLFRKIKRRRKAQAEAEQHMAEKQLRKKLKIPKFGDGKEIGDVKEIINLDNVHLDEEGNLVDNTTGVKYIATTDDIVITPIKKSKRGTFTKAAKQHGMSVQSFANKVLRNPSKYSAAMRKKANFAHNAAGWEH